MSKIIIQLQGGLVQEVFIQGKGIPTKAIVVDEDVEGAEPDNITSVRIKTEKTSLGRGTFEYEACIHTEAINVLPRGSDVDCIIKAYIKK